MLGQSSEKESSVVNKTALVEERSLNLICKIISNREILVAASFLALTQIACGMKEFYTCGGVAIVGIALFGAISLYNDPEARMHREDTKLMRELKVSNHPGNQKSDGKDDGFNPFLYVNNKKFAAQNDWSSADRLRENDARFLSGLFTDEAIQAAVELTMAKDNVSPDLMRDFLSTKEGQALISQLARNTANGRLATTTNRSTKYTQLAIKRTTQTILEIVARAKNSKQ